MAKEAKEVAGNATGAKRPKGPPPAQDRDPVRAQPKAPSKPAASPSHAGEITIDFHDTLPVHLRMSPPEPIPLELSVTGETRIPPPIRSLLTILRFLNMLEPGRYILSISKIYMWIMLALMIYVLLFDAKNVTAVVGAAGGVAGTMGNYAWRRYVHWRSGVVTAVTPKPGDLAGARK